MLHLNSAPSTSIFNCTKVAKLLFPLNSTEGGMPYMPFFFYYITILICIFFVNSLFYQCISMMFLLIFCEKHSLCQYANVNQCAAAQSRFSHKWNNVTALNIFNNWNFLIDYLEIHALPIELILNNSHCILYKSKKSCLNIKKGYILLYGLIYFVSDGFILCYVDIFCLPVNIVMDVIWCGNKCFGVVGKVKSRQINDCNCCSWQLGCNNMEIMTKGYSLLCLMMGMLCLYAFYRRQLHVPWNLWW